MFGIKGLYEKKNYFNFAKPQNHLLCKEASTALFSIFKYQNEKYFFLFVSTLRGLNRILQIIEGDFVCPWEYTSSKDDVTVMTALAGTTISGPLLDIYMHLAWF